MARANLRTNGWLVVACVLTPVISAVVLIQAMLDKPWFRLGVSGEWTWRYEFSPCGDRAVICLVGAVLLGGLCWVARRHALELAGKRLAGFLVLAVFFTLWLQVSFAYLSRVGFGQGVIWTGFHGANSYFGEARQVHSAAEVIAAAQDPNRPFLMHVTTHPPGPVLFYFGLLRAWSRVPGTAVAFSRFMESAMPYAAESRAILEESIVKQPYSTPELATLYSSIMILWLLVALAVLPLYYWAASLFGQRAAVSAIGLYALTPGILLFNPMTDQMWVPIALIMLAAFHVGLTQRDPVQLFLAGILTWLGLQYSLSFFVVLFLVGVYVFTGGRSGKEDWKLLAFAVLSFAAIVLLFLALGYNSLKVWQVCLLGRCRARLAITCPGPAPTCLISDCSLVCR